MIRESDPGRCFEAGGAIEAFIEAKKEGSEKFDGTAKNPKWLEKAEI